MSEGWMEGAECRPWVVGPDGSYLSSGDNRHGPRVRSTLSLRLHMKTAGRLWFIYRWPPCFTWRAQVASQDSFALRAAGTTRRGDDGKVGPTGGSGQGSGLRKGLVHRGRGQEPA